eukprot:scaffold2941_cov102-Isochrysis_galbana.AAC.3
MADASWDSVALAHAVCDLLVAEGKLKEKPAFIRTDREAKIAKVFQAANLDGAPAPGSMLTFLRTARRDVGRELILHRVCLQPAHLPP